MAGFSHSADVLSEGTYSTVQPGKRAWTVIPYSSLLTHTVTHIQRRQNRTGGYKSATRQL